MLGLLLKIRSWFGNKWYVTKTQKVRLINIFNDNDKIIDLGGGGAGVIGVLRGKQVTAIDLRQEELDEIPNGPIKVVADARSLPFEDQSFSAASAFYFLMYLNTEDRKKVMEEAYRVIEERGILHIWDTLIPLPNINEERIFIVPLKILLANRVIRTAYGTRWLTNHLDFEKTKDIAAKVGFKILEEHSNNKSFYLKLQK